ncbi:MAG: PspC domain-containing protein [Caldilineaceae bacterium]|nr:PspC domain-containing protein [Caldilineaceae bacterium]
MSNETTYLAAGNISPQPAEHEVVITNDKGVAPDAAALHRQDQLVEERPMEERSVNVEVTNTERERTPVRPPLYRHPSHQLVGGVCGGIADYLNIDPVLVRILWIVLTMGTAGGGFLAYLTLWLLLPVGTSRTGLQEPATLELNERNVQRAGAILIGLGVLWLLANVGILPWLWNAFWSVMSILFWPALLIGAGLLLIKNQKEWRTSFVAWRERVRSGVRERSNGVKIDRSSVKSGLYQTRQRIPLKRSRSERMVLGVCGGIAETFNVDPNLVRLFWILFSIGSVGTGAVVYALFGLILPERAVQVAEMDYDHEPKNIHIIDGEAR